MNARPVPCSLNARPVPCSLINVRNAYGAASRKLRGRLRGRLRLERCYCWIYRAFGYDDRIDHSLPAQHPMSFEVDDYASIDAVHHYCNQRRLNKNVNETGRGQMNARPAPCSIIASSTITREMRVEPAQWGNDKIASIVTEFLT